MKHKIPMDQLTEINKLTEEALDINRTFAEGVHTRQAMDPTGFLPPNKRVKIVEILEKISKLSSI